MIRSCVASLVLLASLFPFFVILWCSRNCSSTFSRGETFGPFVRAHVRTSFVLPVYASLSGRVLNGGKVPTVRSAVHRKLYTTRQTVSTLLSELGRPDYLSHFPKLETACSSHLSLTCLFFYINTLVGCASIGLKSEGAVTKCVLEPVRIPPL